MPSCRASRSRLDEARGRARSAASGSSASRETLSPATGDGLNIPLPSYRRRPVPPFPGYARALGPGIVWLALAQGSGELIWWPYIVARYGLAFLFLLIPACLIQWPVNHAIGRYTLLTGESILRGFLRLNRWFG